MPAPAISVVIPAYRAEAHLPACLEGLNAQDADPDGFEVIVVDDASPDRTAEVGERYGARVVQHSENAGAAAARNTGVRAARGEVVLFVDSDVVPAPGLVQATMETFADPAVRAATGRYLPEPANEGAFPRYKALWTWFCWEQTGARTGESGHLQGALCAVRREDLLALGGFDGTYEGGSVEDYELSDRLRAAGIGIRFADGIAGRHHFPGMGTVARNYWDRTRMWLRLAPERRGFSSGQANRRAGFAAAAAFGGALGVFPPLWPIAAPAQLAWLAASAPFLGFVWRREGSGFALYCAGVHYALSAVVGAAAVTAPFGRGSRRTG